MAKLTGKERASLPDSAFAGPNRTFPVEDSAHARKALQLVGRSVSAGNTSPSAAKGIRSKARKMLSRKMDGKPVFKE